MDMSRNMITSWIIFLELILYSPKCIIYYRINAHFNRDLDYIMRNTI